MPFAELLRTDDPRNTYERTRRPELVKHGRANGITEINIGGKMVFIGDAPAILIRKELQARGIRPPKIPNRVLGTPSNVLGMGAAIVASDAPIPPAGQIDATDDLARQFASAPPPPKADPAQMTIGDLRKEASRLGLKFTPRNKAIELRQMIAEHGKDAA